MKQLSTFFHPPLDAAAAPATPSPSPKSGTVSPPRPPLFISPGQVASSCVYYTADGSGSPATGTISSCFDCQSSCYNNNACYDWSWEGGSKYSYSDSSGCTGERVKGVLGGVHQRLCSGLQ